MEKVIEVKIGNLPIEYDWFKNKSTDYFYALAQINNAYVESLTCVINMDYITRCNELSISEKLNQIKNEIKKSFAFQEEAKRYISYL